MIGAEHLCQYPRCTREYDLVYIGKKICNHHWASSGDTWEAINAFRDKLGLPPVEIKRKLVVPRKGPPVRRRA